ncbi:hypothetical protein ES703_99014 [subsurface metagenome]
MVGPRKKRGARRAPKAKAKGGVPYVMRGGVRLEGTVAKPGPTNGTGERTVKDGQGGNARGGRD